MKKHIFLLLLIALLLSACSASSTRRPRTHATETPADQSPALTATPKPRPSATPEPTETATVVATPTPVSAMLAQDTTCRLGPGENYYKMVITLKGDKVAPLGRNEDSTWAMINENSSDSGSPTCWIPVSSLESYGNVSGLSVVEYELLPAGPATIRATNGVCGANKPMVVEWSPVVDGVEYRLYRNGKAVSTQSGGKFYDVNIPEKGKATVLTYAVQG